MIRMLFAASSLILLSLSLPVSAAIYEYTDKNGEVHITDRLDPVPADQRSNVYAHDSELSEQDGAAGKSVQAGDRSACEQSTLQVLAFCREVLKAAAKGGNGSEKQNEAMTSVMAFQLCSPPPVEARLAPGERRQLDKFKDAAKEAREQYGIWTVMEAERFAGQFLSSLSAACGQSGSDRTAHGPVKSGDYYPLAAGDVREFRNAYREKDERLADRSEQRIAQQINDSKTGNVEFKNEKGKTVAWRTPEGITTARGGLLLKFPVRSGEAWSSGEEKYDERVNRVEEDGLSVTVNGQQYRDCIKVSSASQFHALARKERGGYYSFESYVTYCPNVGPVLMESYEISREGGRTWTGRSELVSFKRGQNVAADVTADAAFIEAGRSFLFPKKGYLHPALSPNEKWIVYQMTNNFDELYYSSTSNFQEQRVPLDAARNASTRRNVGGASWSPDGSLLAVSVGDDSGQDIALVDFSSSEPKLTDRFRSNGSTPAWTADATLLYLDELGNIMRKVRSSTAEVIVPLRKSFAEAGGAERIFADRQGTILYTIRGTGSRGIYRIPIGSRSMPARFAAEETVIYAIMSPDGIHVFLKSAEKSAIMDHRNGEMVTRLPGVEYAAWSPEGKRLAYLEARPKKVSDKNPRFKIFDLRTKETKDLGITVEQYFSWTPDGNHIIYSAKFGNESLLIVENGVFIMQANDGKEIARLTKISANDNPVISSSGTLVLWPALNMDTFFLVKNPLDPALFKKPASR